jgi:hypothetical protein
MPVNPFVSNFDNILQKTGTLRSINCVLRLAKNAAFGDKRPLQVH